MSEYHCYHCSAYNHIPLWKMVQLWDRHGVQACDDPDQVVFETDHDCDSCWCSFTIVTTFKMTAQQVRE